MNALEEIHMSLVNGQMKQAAAQIKAYGVASFSIDYPSYLDELIEPDYHSYKFLTKAFRAYAYNR